LLFSAKIGALLLKRMSYKIIKQIINYAQSEEVSYLSITEEQRYLNVSYHLANSKIKNLRLRHSEPEFFSDYFRRLLAISQGELVTNYCFPERTIHWLKRWRASILPHENHEKIILHLPKTTQQNFRLNELGLSSNDLKKFQRLIKIHSGLVVLSSPMSEGRSATLRALAAAFNHQNNNIYFIGQAETALISGINYLTPRPDNWEKIMHHDSDIIIADDLDILKDLKPALLAAGSGRLVIISLVATSCLEALNILISHATPNLLKSAQLKLISNQRLVNRRRQTKNNPLSNRQQIGIFEVLTWSSALNQPLAKLINRTKGGAQLEQGLKEILTETEFSPLAADYQRKLSLKLI